VAEIMVVAPHPDDESIGCGGMMCLHEQRGEAVQVVFLTSGERGIEGVASELAQSIREAEASKALAILGVERMDFLRLPDLGLWDAGTAAATRLGDVFKASPPRLIYLPHPQEAHPDHAATLPIVRAALAKAFAEGQLPELRAYEVWTPMEAFEWPEDISAVMARKLRAVRCYRSQLKNFQYDRAVRGLNQFRGCLAARCRYAEVFKYLLPR
jgi:LmbE family N-acetylglucosaminyl deacetylase